MPPAKPASYSDNHHGRVARVALLTADRDDDGHHASGITKDWEIFPWQINSKISKRTKRRRL